MSKVLDRRYKIPQVQIDFIAKGIGKMKTKADIAREVSAEFHVSYSTARGRVDLVWKRISASPVANVGIERHRIAAQLLEMYHDARADTLDKMSEKLEEMGVPPEHAWRILNKWDPYKAQAIALKALEQYTKLVGADAPQRVETHHKHEMLNPLTLTPQERRKRIAELVQKRQIEPPKSGLDSDESVH